MTRLMAALTVLALTSSGLHHWEALEAGRWGGVLPCMTDLHAVHYHVKPAPVADDAPDPAREREKARRFTAVTTVSLNQLHEDKIRLDEACDRLLVYSVLHYPDYLLRLGHHEQGQSLREKIGQDLVRRLRGHLLAGRGPEASKSVALSRLENELRELRRTEGVRLAKRRAPSTPPAGARTKDKADWQGHDANPPALDAPSGMS